MISRDQIKNITIFQSLENNEEKTQFQSFKSSWEKIPEKILKLKKSSKKQNINETSTLSSLFISNEDSEGAYQISEVIKNLSNLHNSLLKTALEKTSLNFEKSSLPPHFLTEENIISSSCIQDKNLTRFIVYNPEYGKGNEFFFDFESFQNSLLDELEKKKFINVDKLKTIQFKSDIFNNPSVNPVDFIRKHLKQSELSLEDEQNLKKYLKHLEAQSSFDDFSVIKELHCTSAFVLHQLKYFHAENSENIEKFCNRLKLSGFKINEKYLHENISKKTISCILSIHCLIERFYFKYYSESLMKEEFKDMSQESEIKDLIKFIRNNKDEFPACDVFKDALCRLMIRCGDEIDFSVLLENYLFRDDFWPFEKFLSEKENLKRLLMNDENKERKSKKRFSLKVSSAFELFSQLSRESWTDVKSETLKVLERDLAA